MSSKQKKKPPQPKLDEEDKLNIILATILDKAFGFSLHEKRGAWPKISADLVNRAVDIEQQLPPFLVSSS
ncbi:MAG: hypothetical protein AAGG69_11750 [Pseudomonadota bacterium]